MGIALDTPADARSRVPKRNGRPVSAPLVEARNRACPACGGRNGSHASLRCWRLKREFKRAAK